MKQSRFYKIMDIMEDYDLALSNVNESFGQAMLNLAYIHFINPYSSVTPHGYKPSPALLRHDKTTNKLIFTQDGQYIKKVDEQQLEEHEQQVEIEERVKSLIKRQDLTQQQKIISRFGNISNQGELVKTSRKFRTCLQNIMELASKKRQVLQKLREIQMEILTQKTISKSSSLKVEDKNNIN